MLKDELDSKLPDVEEGTRQQKAKSKLSEFLRTFQNHQSFSLYGIAEVRRSVIKIRKHTIKSTVVCTLSVSISRHRQSGE